MLRQDGLTFFALLVGSFALAVDEIQLHNAQTNAVHYKTGTLGL